MLSNECHWCLGERLYKANCEIQSAFKTVYKETLISCIQKAGEARPGTSRGSSPSPPEHSGVSAPASLLCQRKPWVRRRGALRTEMGSSGQMHLKALQPQTPGNPPPCSCGPRLCLEASWETTQKVQSFKAVCACSPGCALPSPLGTRPTSGAKS